jgi:hypothetical protein
MAVKTYGLDKKQIALCDAMIEKYPKGIRTNNVVSSASTLVSFYNSKDERNKQFYEYMVFQDYHQDDLNNQTLS